MLTLATALFSIPLFAQADAGSPSLDLAADLTQPLLLAVVFTVIGVVLFGICIWLVVKVSPFSIRKEIEEDQNIALGLIIGAMILGIAMILSAAIRG